MNRLLTSTAALLILSAVALGLPNLASAHANYESSSPGRGEQLVIAPSEVEITFTQDIQKIAGTYSITVNKDRGLDVTAGPAVVNDADRTKLSVPLQPDLADGRYVVNWSNVSDADGDPKNGAFSFYLNHTPTAVDLANDAALEQIGAEGETPAAGETATATLAPDESPSATAASATDTAETPAPTPGSADADDDDSGVNVVLFIAIGAVAAAAIAGGTFFFMRSR